MEESLCGIDCAKCEIQKNCDGCLNTNGRPFGKQCIVALCQQKGELALCQFKAKLIAAFNALRIEDMAEVKLRGSFINLEYQLESGQIVKFWDDDKIYLGNQVCKKGSNRCYGLAADEKYLLVCEYGDLGAAPKIVVYKQWQS